MPDTTAPVTSQPAPTAQIVDAAQTNGPENVGVTAYARQFLNKPVVAPTPTEPAQAAPEPTTAEPIAPATETVPEAESPPQAEVHAEEAEEALSQSTSIPPEVQETINKRIAKITAKRKEAERRAEAAEAAFQQLAQAKQPEATKAPEPQQSVEIPNQPLAKIQTMQELQKLHKEATEAVQFAEYNLDRDDMVERQVGNEVVRGVEINGEFYSKKVLRDIKFNAMRVKDTEIPARAQFLTTQHQAVQQALEAYPFLKDPASPEYQLADQFAREMPWLKNVPNSLNIIGKMVLGAKVEQEATKGKPPVKPAPVKQKPAGDQTAVSSSDTGITRVPAGTQAKREMAQEDQKLTSKGGVSAAEFAASLTRKAQLRRTT